MTGQKTATNSAHHNRIRAVASIETHRVVPPISNDHNLSSFIHVGLKIDELDYESTINIKETTHNHFFQSLTLFYQPCPPDCFVAKLCDDFVVATGAEEWDRHVLEKSLRKKKCFQKASKTNS